MPPECSIVFIAGIPRSGTTLLRLVLSAHPAVAISPESHSLEKIIFRFPHTRPLRGAELEELKGLILSDAKLAGWKIDHTDYFAKVAGYTETSVRQAALDMMDHYRTQSSPQATIIGNKKGFFAEYGEVAGGIFPEARFITIVRDARDAVLSMKTNLAGYDAIGAGVRWRARVQRSRRLADRYPGQCLLIRYEDLVSGPEPECRRMCDFLGIEFTEEMLRFYEGNRRQEQIIEGTEAIHRMTSNPFTRARIGVWREGLSDDEVRTVQTIAGRELAAMGYAVDGRRLRNPLRRAACSLARWGDDLRWWRNLRRAG